MRVIFVLFDSLNKRALELYGGTTIKTPYFNKLSERGVTFDSHFVGSLPCMPARRDLHSGRLNFLHRSWGPLEPFDNSFSEILQTNNIYTHLVSDHYHYWEDGGSTYHNRYNTWEFIRGQEWDKWQAMVVPPLERFKKKYHELQHPKKNNHGRLQSMINRENEKEEKDYCCPRTFEAAFDFLNKNKDADNWLLHLECFDPHEPFDAPKKYKEPFKTGYTGPILNWPIYKKNQENEIETNELRANYAALLSMCNEYFGKLLEFMDKNKMWDDTCVILTTDHGFMLEEHGWWGKNRMPFFNEIANIPLIIYHPDFKEYAGSRKKILTQTIDLMPTILDIFGVNIPNNIEGRSILPALSSEKKIRDFAMFGMFGAATNITDGRYTYFRYPEDMTKEDLYDYTLMPMYQRSLFTKDILSEAELVKIFKFTDGVPVLKIPARRNQKGQPVGHFSQGGGFDDTNTVLYDLETDPDQKTPIYDKKIEKIFSKALYNLMKENEAPSEAFRRLGI